MVKKYVIFVFLTLSGLFASAQTDGNYDYTKEFIWGINKNTRGGLIGGFIFKWGTSISETQFRTIGLELMNVKHPKEFRIRSQNGNQFIYAKENYLYAIRLQYGRDFLLYKKAPQQGVQINASVAGGPTIGVIAPYYVRNVDGRTMQYDPNFHVSPNSISGTGQIFQGLGQSKIKPGIHVKGSISFELGAFKSNVTGFEVGVLGEVYAGKINLMPFEESKAGFMSAFITLFYGKRK